MTISEHFKATSLKARFLLYKEKNSDEWSIPASPDDSFLSKTRLILEWKLLRWITSTRNFGSRSQNYVEIVMMKQRIKRKHKNNFRTMSSSDEFDD